MGRAEVRDTFRVKGVGMIAGCSVQEGILKRDADVRVLRDNVVIYTGKINSLRRFKEDASEVRAGFECGAGISNFNDVKVGDSLECFKIEKSRRWKLRPIELHGRKRRWKPGAARSARAGTQPEVFRCGPKLVSSARACLGMNGNADRSPHTGNSHC